MENGKASFRFRNWKVYKDAQEVFVEVVGITRRLPSDLHYSLGSQIIRSSLSIVLNIAEGSGHYTDRELKRFFDISIGSVSETAAGLDSLVRLKVVKQSEVDLLNEKLGAVALQLQGFKKSM